MVIGLSTYEISGMAVDRAVVQCIRPHRHLWALPSFQKRVSTFIDSETCIHPRTDDKISVCVAMQII